MTVSSDKKDVAVLLVEDDGEWQAGIASLLETHPRFRLVAVTDHYEAAVNAFQKHLPDLVLLDWQIRGRIDGLGVGHALLKLGAPAERIIVISGSAPSRIPRHPFRFVGKGRIASELLSAMEESITEY